MDIKFGSIMGGIVGWVSYTLNFDAAFVNRLVESALVALFVGGASTLGAWIMSLIIKKFNRGNKQEMEVKNP